MRENAHWILEDYRQRMTTSKWRAILLDKADIVIVNGRLRQLKATNLGYGVVEVSKEPLNIEVSNEDR